MSRRSIIERERRWAPWAAAGAVLPLLLFFAAVFAQPRAAVSGDLLTETLRVVNENKDAVVLSSVLGSVGIMLTALPLVYLFRAAQARAPQVNSMLIGFCVLGPLLYGVKGILLALAQVDVAEQFAAQENSVGDIYTLSENLLEQSGLYTAAGGIELAGILGLLFAMVYTPLWAMRTGLLTRFHATLGMALGVVLILGPIGRIALPGLMIWFLFLGLIILNRAPGRNRPPAWDAGEAIPWPRPGEEPVDPAAELGDDVIEGDASEIPGVGENPNAARRERAKRRKRKRRR